MALEPICISINELGTRFSTKRKYLYMEKVVMDKPMFSRRMEYANYWMVMALEWEPREVITYCLGAGDNCL